MYHYRKTRKTYARHNSADKKSKAECSFPFCNPNSRQPVREENETMYIIDNRVSYDVFEGRRVADHLMVIPKRHVETMASFTDQEKLDHMTLLGRYESAGYNVYARGVGSVSRSVKHQHTHLIKLTDKQPRAVIYAKKPYVLIDF